MIIWTHSPSSNQGSFPIPKPHEGGLKLCLWTTLQPLKAFCVLMKTSSYGWDWILLVLSDLSWRPFLSRSPVRGKRWFLVNSVSICEYFEQLVCADLPSACRKKPCSSSSEIHLWLNSFNPLKLFCLSLLWFISHTWPTESLECWVLPEAGWRGKLDCRYRPP